MRLASLPATLSCSFSAFLARTAGLLGADLHRMVDKMVDEETPPSGLLLVLQGNKQLERNWGLHFPCSYLWLHRALIYTGICLQL